MTHCMYIPHFVYPLSIHGHLGCFLGYPEWCGALGLCAQIWGDGLWKCDNVVSPTSVCALTHLHTLLRCRIQLRKSAVGPGCGLSDRLPLILLAWWPFEQLWAFNLNITGVWSLALSALEISSSSFFIFLNLPPLHTVRVNSISSLVCHED